MSKEDELIADLAEHPGWRELVEVINDQRNANLRSLDETKFNDLADVARLQGENAAFKRILSYVNNRR